MKQCKECGMEYLNDRPHCHLDCWNYEGATEDTRHLEKKLKSCEQSHADLEKTLDEAIKTLKNIAAGTADETYPFRAAPRDELKKIAHDFLKTLEE